jgi:hypothetical protein
MDIYRHLYTSIISKCFNSQMLFSPSAPLISYRWAHGHTLTYLSSSQLPSSLWTNFEPSIPLHESLSSFCYIRMVVSVSTWYLVEISLSLNPFLFAALAFDIHIQSLACTPIFLSPFFISTHMLSSVKSGVTSGWP